MALSVSRAQAAIDKYRDFGTGGPEETPDLQVAQRIVVDILDWCFEHKHDVSAFLFECREDWANRD